MNAKASTYILKHGRYCNVSGEQVLMLPLERIQGFLDLLQPSDVPPEKLQTLYAMQDRLVATVRDQLTLPPDKTA